MSAINEFLQLIKLRVNIYHNARVCGDWRINEHELGSTCFHIPTQGDCLLDVPGHGNWRLNEGELVIFPKELPHQMRPAAQVSDKQEHLPISSSQHLSGTSMLCGSVSFEHRSGDFLLSALPPVLIGNDPCSKPWLQPLTSLIVNESLRPDGSDNPMLARLSELLIVMALRCFSENYEHDQNLLALYGSSRLAPAVAAIHQRPEHPWQLASLAEECLMSRTQFAKLFRTTTGMTAMQYLTWWRMQLAWRQLHDGASVGAVADAVGYLSEAAFAKAFKQMFGQTVGSVRRHSV